MKNSTLADIFSRDLIIAEYGKEFAPTCAVCYSEEVTHYGDLCKRCASEKILGYQIMQLSGRCVSGAERGHGILYHAVPLGSLRALCRAKPGRRSAGWSSYHGEEVTCPKCIAALARAEK